MILSEFQREIVHNIISLQVKDVYTFLKLYFFNGDKLPIRRDSTEGHLTFNHNTKVVIEKLSSFLSLWDKLEKVNLIKSIEAETFGIGFEKINAYRLVRKPDEEIEVVDRGITGLLNIRLDQEILPFKSSLEAFIKGEYYINNGYLTESEFNKKETLLFQDKQLKRTTALAIGAIIVSSISVIVSIIISVISSESNKKFLINSQRPFLEFELSTEYNNKILQKFRIPGPPQLSMDYRINNFGSKPSLKSVLRFALDTSRTFPHLQSQFYFSDTLHNIIFPNKNFISPLSFDSSKTLYIDNFFINQKKEHLYLHVHIEYSDPLRNQFYYGGTYKIIPKFDDVNRYTKEGIDELYKYRSTYSLTIRNSYDNIQLTDK